MNFPKRRKFSGSGILTHLTDRGFGFIKRDGSEKDIFFHSNELTDIKFDELREGDAVGFDIVANPKGLSAVNVSRDGRQQDEEITDKAEIADDIDDVEVRVVIENLSARLAEIIARNPNALGEIEWRDLERVIAEVFAGLGFDAELRQGSKDGGKDVVISYSVSNKMMSYIVEIKHWRSGKRVGRGPVSKFIHVIAKENRSGGILLATSGFTKTAFESITEIEHVEFGLGIDAKVIGLCRNYVKAKEGIWYPPEQLDKVIFDDTLRG